MLIQILYKEVNKYIKSCFFGPSLLNELSVAKCNPLRNFHFCLVLIALRQTLNLFLKLRRAYGRSVCSFLAIAKYLITDQISTSLFKNCGRIELICGKFISVVWCSKPQK